MDALAAEAARIKALEEAARKAAEETLFEYKPIDAPELKPVTQQNRQGYKGHSTKAILHEAAEKTTRTGRELDALSAENYSLHPDDLKPYKAASGRKIVEVPLPDGGTQLFYKSSGLGKKVMADGASSKGKWLPFEGLIDTGKTSGYFMKTPDIENYYGSESFKAIGETLEGYEAQGHIPEPPSGISKLSDEELDWKKTERLYERLKTGEYPDSPAPGRHPPGWPVGISRRQSRAR